MRGRGRLTLGLRLRVRRFCSDWKAFLYHRNHRSTFCNVVLFQYRLVTFESNLAYRPHALGLVRASVMRAKKTLRMFSP